MTASTQSSRFETGAKRQSAARPRNFHKIRMLGKWSRRVRLVSKVDRPALNAAPEAAHPGKGILAPFERCATQRLAEKRKRQNRGLRDQKIGKGAIADTRSGR